MCASLGKTYIYPQEFPHLLHLLLLPIHYLLTITMKSVIFTLIGGAAAFPFVANAPGVNSPWSGSGLHRLRARQQPGGEGAGSEANCPYNPNHVPAAPFNPKYPYNNAKNGQMGNQKGGYLVPAKGDTAHQFVAPNPKTDIRGPCPGLNAAANHNFLAHDGVTTFVSIQDADGYPSAQPCI